MAEEEIIPEVEQQPPQLPQKKKEKIDAGDEILNKFINTYHFNPEIKDADKGILFNIASASIGNNIFIIKNNGNNNYSFSIVNKENYDIYKENFKKEKKDEKFTFKFINFNTKYFKENEQKFIDSLKENKMFDDKKKVKDGTYEDFKKKTLQALTNHESKYIKVIDPIDIQDIQDEPEPKKKDEEELMGDDDEEEEEEGMIDEDEEEEKRKMKKDDEEEEKPDAFEDNQVFLANEYDKEKEYSDDERELFKQAKKMKDRKLKKQLEEYNKKFHPEQEIQQEKKRSGVMNEKDREVFDQLTEDLGFTKVKGPGGQSYLRVGDDVIFIRKVPKKKKDSAIFKNDPYLAVKLNKKDFQRLYNKQNIDDIEAEYFNFNTDYFNENKDKFKKAIKEGEFEFDDYIKEAKERLKEAGIQSNIGDKFTYEQIQDYGIIPGKKNFNYVKMFDLKRGNISEERIDDGQQLIKFSKDGKNVTVNLPNKYSSNGYPDSLLKLIVGVSENNKGEVDFKEIGEIQDLNGDITNLYSDMQDLKSKINSSNSEREKERLLIKYNKKRLKLEDLVKKYSKEAYRLSTLKKKKATMATHKYIMNKLNKLKT